MRNPFFILLLLIAVALNIEAQPLALQKPKNIIIMIGDGMGFNQLKATEYYLYGSSDSSFLRGKDYIHLAQATYPAVINTKKDKIYTSGYNVEGVSKNPRILMNGCTDSGAAATALATGKKTYNGAIGIGIENDTLFNLVELAKSLDKSAGIVTSVPVSHATPAGFVAHNSRRNHYEEIARQIIFNSKLDVLMGCGNPDYDKSGKAQKMNAKYVGGDTIWNNLKSSKPMININIHDTIYTVQDVDNDGKSDPWFLIQDSSDFARLTSDNTPKRILGIPKVYETLQQERNSGDTLSKVPFETSFIKEIPTLNLMTAGALNCLSKNEKGFFMMVEGGAIDWASHDNKSGSMIEEMVNFLNTLEGVVDWVNKNSNWNETLLIVTADHESGFLWGEESNEIFNPIIGMGKGKLPKMKWYSTDHTNSLVPFFAKGAGSDIFNLFADEYDPNYGHFIQNTEVAQVVFLLWNLSAK